MTDSEKALDYLERQIPSLSAAAVDAAYWQALPQGKGRSSRYILPSGHE